MTTTEDLGRRWVASCKRAGVSPWAPGMLVGNGFRVLWAYPNGLAVAPESGGLSSRIYYPVSGPLWWPDLTDDATLGAAMGILRRAWGGALAVSACDTTALVTVWHPSGKRALFDAPALGEAITAAMEAAPA